MKESIIVSQKAVMRFYLMTLHFQIFQNPTWIYTLFHGTIQPHHQSQSTMHTVVNPISFTWRWYLIICHILLESNRIKCTVTTYMLHVLSRDSHCTFRSSIICAISGLQYMASDDDHRFAVSHRSIHLFHSWCSCSWASKLSTLPSYLCSTKSLHRHQPFPI